jgi:hypothetical protein
MDLQSRTTEYGAGRHHAHAEIEARCLAPLLADAKNGGITGRIGLLFNLPISAALCSLVFLGALRQIGKAIGDYCLDDQYLPGHCAGHSIRMVDCGITCIRYLST